MILQNGSEIGRYRIEKPLSEKGGMASVFVANPVDNPKCRVAIKIARTDADHAVAEDVLLQREAEFLSRWDWRHSGIVRLYPLLTARGKNADYTLRVAGHGDRPWYMVMEYLRGHSLAENRKKIKKYPLEWKLELFYQLLVTVSFLHQKGYAHRDLKPDNIVFRDPISLNAIPQPVLVDFALTTNGEEDYNIVESAYTVEYTAPEIIRRAEGIDTSRNRDPRPADIWSLGVIFYEIITGGFLLKGKREKILTTIIKQQLEPQLSEDDPRHHLLAAFIRNMLKRDPRGRPTIKELLYAIEEKFLPPRIII